MNTAIKSPATIPRAGISIAPGASEEATSMPLFRMLPSTTSLMKILPNPTGRTMYGVISPKVRIQATIRRSSRSRSNTGSSGGIRIGMNAMCTGMRF